MIELVIFVALVIVGYTAGTFIEQRHFTSIRRREEELVCLPAIASDEIDGKRVVEDSMLVVGVAVIAVDYFKVIAASLASFFGCRITTYETLLDRARRESILRMKEKAKGYDIIIHTRLETCALGAEHNHKGKVHSVECFAYGTAVRYVELNQ